MRCHRSMVAVAAACVALLLLALQSVHAAPAQCVTLPKTSPCYTVLGYTSVYQGVNMSISTIETELAQAPNLWSFLSDACRPVVARMMCSEVYPPCVEASGTVMPVPACMSQCTAAQAVCHPTYELGILEAMGGPKTTCDTTHHPYMVDASIPPPYCNDGNRSAAAPGPLYPRCQPYAGTVCKGVINYSVYVPTGLSQTILEAQLAPMAWIMSLAVNGSTCAARQAEYMCSQAFMRCDTDVMSRLNGYPAGSPPQIPFPRLPCQSVCNEFETECASLIAIQPLATTGCAGMGGVIPGQPNFPAAGTIFGFVGSSPLQTLCNVFSVTERAVSTVPVPTLPANSCFALPKTSVCAPYIDYTNTGANATYVFLPPQAHLTLALVEDMLATLPTVLAILSPACGLALARWQCGSQLMRCGASGMPHFACKPECDALSSCTATEKGLLGAFGISFPTCANFPVATTGSCNAMPAPVMTAPLTPKCMNYTGATCRGIVDYEVYVPWQVTMDYLEAQVAGNAYVKIITPKKDGCREQFLQYLCSQAFNRCDKQVVKRGSGGFLDVPAPFPRLPCRHICTGYQTKCAFFNAALGMKTNCTTVGTRAPAGLDDWPVSNTVLGTVAGGLVTLATPCNEWNSTEIALFKNYLTCPAPLLIPADPATPTIALPWGQITCAVPCPTLAFTRSQWKAASAYFFSFTLLSFLGTLFTLLTWIFDPAKRAQKILLNLNICVFCISVVLLIPYFPYGVHGLAEIGCKNDSEQVTQDTGSLCAFQGVMFYYFMMAGIIWWVVQSWDVFEKIVLLRGPHAPGAKASPADTNGPPPDAPAVIRACGVHPKKSRSCLYHSLAWCLPLIGVIIGLAAKQFQPSSTVPYCFVGGNYWTDFTIFHYPTIILGVVGLGMMIASWWKLPKKKPGAKHPGRRSVLFVLAFFVTFIIIFIYRVALYVVAQAPGLGAATKYVQCLLGGGDLSKCSLDAMYPLTFVIMFAISANGVVFFISYGTRRDNFRFWARVIQRQADGPNKYSNVETQGSGGSTGTAGATAAPEPALPTPAAAVEMSPMRPGVKAAW